MDFLDKLYSSNYFGIGLFAVIAFLVVTFLIVLFFGKKDEKKRKLEVTQNLEATDTFKETTKEVPVEIPTNPEPVAPIDLDPVSPLPVEEKTEPVISENKEPLETVIPVAPVAPINEEYVENLTVEEPAKEEVKPVIDPISPIINEEPVAEPVKLEPTKINIPIEPVNPVINEGVTPVIKEEEPKLQINEEPILNTYYKPIEKTTSDPIKVPNIDFDSLAKSISKELDELENDTKKYEEIKVTPISEVAKTETNTVKQPETFSSVYVKEEPKTEIELPKRIDLPVKKND